MARRRTLRQRTSCLVRFAGTAAAASAVTVSVIGGRSHEHRVASVPPLENIPPLLSRHLGCRRSAFRFFPVGLLAGEALLPLHDASAEDAGPECLPGEGGSSPAPKSTSSDGVFRTQQQPPKIPAETGVMLLRTTVEAAQNFYKTPTDFDKDFSKLRMSSMQSFKTRYQNYNLASLLDSSPSSDGGISNRFYFAFLNGLQWQAIGKTVTSNDDRKKFTRAVGDKLYKATLNGQRLGSDGSGEASGLQANEGSGGNVQDWPQIASPPASGNSAGDIADGSKKLLSYLKDRSYCKSFDVSNIQEGDGGSLAFSTRVEDPANFEAIETLMKGNGFPPQYDQGLLQAYFADRGFAADFKDAIDGKGVKTQWTLTPTGR